MSDQVPFTATFQALRTLLHGMADGLSVAADEPDHYALDMPTPYYKDQRFFASAQIKKRYVVFYLMPLYLYPVLGELLSEELQRRRHGKSCFNFTTVDGDLFAELEQVARQGLARLQAQEGDLF